MTSSKLRSSSSLPNLLLSALNLLLFLISSASFVPLFLLRTPPTPFGWALFTASAATLLSSLLGFYSHHIYLCFIAHISLVLSSALGQALGSLALLLLRDPCLRLLASSRSPGEQRLLVKIEEGMLLGMFAVQSAVLVSACVVQSYWVREYEGLEAAVRKRSRRMTRVEEEVLANAEVAAEAKAGELDERMRSKYGQWVKNEFAG